MERPTLRSPCRRTERGRPTEYETAQTTETSYVDGDYFYVVELNRMARGAHLGEFEQIVMLAVARLGDDAYGMTIRREIEARAGRAVSLGAVYATLDRLTDKTMVRVRRDDQARRPRWFFTLTSTGVAALERSRQIQTRMWAGLSLRRSKARP